MRMVLILALLALFNSLSASQTDSQRRAFVKSLLSPDTEMDEALFTLFIDKQNERISTLTQAIYEQKNFVKQAYLLNERGTVYFFTGEFKNAINDFDYVIDNIGAQLPDEKALMGTALWARMLCHAFDGQADNTHNDCQMIRALLTECSCDKSQKKEELEVPFILANCNDCRTILPIAKFGYPEEKISRGECHDRVRTVASKAHTLAELIPEYFIRQTAKATINWVANESHKCCDTPKHWTECLGSIIDVWKNLQNCWEDLVDLFKRGTDIESFLTKPFNW